ncbi:hypothetical protein ABGC70_004364 [Escherichia coli]
MKEWCMRIIFVAFLAIATVILCLFMTGCAQRYESGHDQLFELSERHIIYRDLTVPASMSNSPEKQQISVPGIEP